MASRKFKEGISDVIAIFIIVAFSWFVIWYGTKLQPVNEESLYRQDYNVFFIKDRTLTHIMQYKISKTHTKLMKAPFSDVYIIPISLFEGEENNDRP